MKQEHNTTLSRIHNPISSSLSFLRERKHVHNIRTTKEREKKFFFVGSLGNYASELKLLLTTLLLLCVVATLLPFLPSRFFFPPYALPSTPLSSTTQVLSNFNGIIKRVFNPYGSAAYNFITMGAYRGGLNTFAIVGLASKPLHVYGKPTYECEWIPFSSSSKKVITMGYKIIPDYWGFGRVYTVVVVNCTFNHTTINAHNTGGILELHASTSGAADTNYNITDKIQVIYEAPGVVDASVFVSKPKYDYLYCGSPLYGNLNPQRIREWIAYHVRSFGPRSHFVLYDAGGVHAQVLEVLKPWMDLGYVTLQDIRDQKRFDGYYHNQFMVVNDCLHRYKFMAKWMFFFDVDEFIYVPPMSTIEIVLDSFSEYSQITIKQMPMSNKICLSKDYGDYRKWNLEKLVYRENIKVIRRNRKYVVQPRNVYAAGVHISLDLVGETTHKTEGRIMYFHYHGTIAKWGESCNILVNSTQVTHDKDSYVLDTRMKDISSVIKKFELKMIGPRSRRQDNNIPQISPSFFS